MISENLFFNLSSKKIAEQIRKAQFSVCFAGPGIQLGPAQALAEKKDDLKGMITVCLDVDERSIRMGYGDIDAIDCLRTAGIKVRNLPGLRTAFFFVDNEGFMFTPTALYLETEDNESIPNAIKLSQNQILDIQGRISPEGKAIAELIAGGPSDEKMELSETSLEVQTNEIEQKDLEQIKTSLEKFPPTKFDIARRVRIFQPYFQYVELSLSGVAIQRNKVKIPKEIQSLGASNDLEGRLKTTFDLIERDSNLSSKHIEENLNEVRNLYTPSLGKKHNRVVLKSSKKRLNEKIKKLRTDLKNHQEKVKKEIQSHLDASRNQIIEYYHPLAKKNPPEALLARLPHEKPTDEDIKKWIGRRIYNVFPSAESIVHEMKLEVRFKDITYETLNENDFLDSIKKAFPDIDWDKAYKEFKAAGELKSN